MKIKNWTAYLGDCKVKQYFKRPLNIEALYFDWKNIENIKSFIWNDYLWYWDNYVKIKTLEWIVKIPTNYYIIKWIEWEFYWCKPTIFSQTYCEYDWQ